MTVTEMNRRAVISAVQRGARRGAITASFERNEALQACVREARAAGKERLAARALELSIRELWLRQRLRDLRAEIVFGVIGVEEWAMAERDQRLAEAAQ